MHPIIQQIKQHTSALKLRPPVSDAAVVEAERRIGFPLPSLVRELYTSIADGGFGPSYGLLPLLTSLPDSSLVNQGQPQIESVTDLYVLFKMGDPEDASWVWPDRLLPILEWGCAIRSCVDCNSPALQVIRDEPYVSRTIEANCFEDWLQAWIKGRDLWHMLKV